VVFVVSRPVEAGHFATELQALSVHSQTLGHIHWFLVMVGLNAQVW
jgi:hypothetical protein